jgi:NAD(P)-dependent dehydrogenase (short-subunit alcohol dehydrogenase family)
MSQELMSEGIRVTGVAPGLIATHFSELLWKNNPNLIKESVGTAEEIGSAVALICSRDGRFMNGEVFPVHGGFAKLWLNLNWKMINSENTNLKIKTSET